MSLTICALPGCRGGVEGRLLSGVGRALTLPTVVTEGGDDILTVHEGEPISWEVVPDTLPVLRDESVTLSVVPSSTVDATDIIYEWSFGADLGAVTTTEPTVTKTIPGGYTDRFVTLTILAGDSIIHRSTRKLSIERIPPMPGTLADIDRPPVPPPSGTDTVRVAFVADLGEADDVRLEIVLDALVETIRPSMVVLLGNALGEKKETARASGLVTALVEAGIQTIPVRGAEDAPSQFASFWKETKHTPALDLIDGDSYPYRYSFARDGSFFAVLDSAADTMPEPSLKWLNRELNASTVYSVRILVTSKPLHKLTADDTGTAPKPFRIYEALNRTKASLLVTGHAKIYYEGVYGSVPVLAAGAVAGQCHSPTGADTCQEHTIPVIDIKAGAIAQIFAAVAPDFTTVYPDALLPSTIEEVYKRE